MSVQHSISGSFSMTKDYKWLITSHLKAGSKTNIADTAIKNGKFTLNFPMDAIPGSDKEVVAFLKS